MNPNYPYPIVFGALNKNRPYPELNLKMIRGSQRVFSRTNYNLFLKPDEAENLSWKVFLKNLDDILGDVTNRKRKSWTSDCRMCDHDQNGRICGLFIKSAKEGVDVKFTPDGATITSRQLELWSSNDFSEGLPYSSCALIQALLKMPDTEAERKFLLDYIHYIFGWQAIGFDELGLNEVQPIAARLAQDTEYTYREAKSDLHNLVLAPYPALVPQVWLNYIYSSRLGPADPERRRLETQPSRVDFIMLWEGKRHVIEIDGPEHYAKFQDGQYVPDEKLYTKNLRIERALRSEGWIIHRFSNLEIADSDWFAEPFASELGLMRF